MSYCFSLIVMLLIRTGSTRDGPQMNRRRGTGVRGTGWVAPPAPAAAPSALPIASMAAPMNPPGAAGGYTIFSSAASCGPMPNRRGTAPAAPPAPRSSCAEK